jgi:hypothetical protein
MKSFIDHHARSVIGVLSGFDRLVFRGRLQRLSYAAGLNAYLYAAGVLLKDFGQFAGKTTEQLKSASLQRVIDDDRPVRYLASSRTRKEELVQEIIARDDITEGTVCAFTCVEPCPSYEIYKNRETHKLELRSRHRKGLHLYHYFIHPRFGLTGARIQTWFPFHVQVWINGREWLTRQMDAAGIGYRRRDNCFTWVEDYRAAQRLFDQQVRINWVKPLNQIADRLFPNLHELLPPPPLWSPFEYHWTAHQSEWATDVTFGQRAQLREIYPRLVRHAVSSFGPSDVMRFLGRKVNRDDRIPKNFNGQITLDVAERPEGTRLKYWIDHNSTKMYDKWNNLRIETTINDPRPFKVYRTTESDPDGPLRWLPMRKGISSSLGR